MTVADEVANVSVLITADDLIGIASLEGESSYVYLAAEGLGSDTSARSEVILPLNLSPGYIFIQTDKPIYTPDQTGEC